VVKKSSIGNRKSAIGNDTVAIFGGTFDPPHNGHVKIAETVLDSGRAGKVIFVPAYHPPHKPSSPVTEFKHRFRMLKLATSSNARFNVSELESRRAGPSYTSDTMMELDKMFPRTRHMLLIGSDSLRMLHTWYKAPEIVAKWPLIVYPRKGEIPSLDELKSNWGGEVAEKLMGYILPMTCIDVSSTEIRSRIASGKSIKGLVNDAVDSYIRKNKIY